MKKKKKIVRMNSGYEWFNDRKIVQNEICSLFIRLTEKKTKAKNTPCIDDAI